MSERIKVEHLDDRVRFSIDFPNGDYVRVEVDKQGKLIFIDVVDKEEASITWKDSIQINQELNETKR